MPIDDTRDQTAAVMKAIAAGNGRPVALSEWHELQYWVADGERRVVVPYATQLAKLIPPIAVRLRRDFGSLLGLTRAHALLRKATRTSDDEGRSVASIDDYVAVRNSCTTSSATGSGRR